MSLILDALRKAEQDRKIGKPPGISGLPIVARAGRSRGLWAGLLITAGSLAGLIGFLVWQSAQQQRPAPSEAAVSDARATRMVTTPRHATETNSAVLGDRGMEKSSSLPTVSNPLSADIKVTAMPVDTSPRADTQSSNPAEVEIPDQVNPGARLQPVLGTYRHLSAERRGEIGVLNLNVHVFASQPEDRFVLINMQRLGENDVLNARLKVVEIGEFGVLMDYAGLQFRLLKQ